MKLSIDKYILKFGTHHCDSGKAFCFRTEHDINRSLIIRLFNCTIFRLIIPDSNTEPFGPCELGPLYQNQEEDPEVRAMMDKMFWESDQLPDLPESS